MAVSSEHTFQIPRIGETPLELTLQGGDSIVLIGANGSGKTRLGVYFEDQLSRKPVQRIAAQKSLKLNDSISLPSLERAKTALSFGYPGGHHEHKRGNRWGENPATHFLNDFDALLQSLFAEHNRIASKHLQDRKLDAHTLIPTTKLEELKRIWERLLPHRRLEILDASINVYTSAANGQSYPGSEMSDGERAIFYFIGQCLIAPEDAFIIIDEPEGHIHRAIIGPLWGAIEAARPDCCFIYITHDLEFAGAHNAIAKYFIRGYSRQPEEWQIVEVQRNSELPESVVAEIVGSRTPILFVEGDRGSLDTTIYRSRYPQFTIVPVGSCEAVIHCVASYSRSAALHRLGVAGLVDGDFRTQEEIDYLKERGVVVLPVAEIENVLLIPDVFLALAKALACTDPPSVLDKMAERAFLRANAHLDDVSLRFTKRDLDRVAKRVSLTGENIAELAANYAAALAAFSPQVVFDRHKSKLQECVSSSNLLGVLGLYDNKGLLAEASTVLGLRSRDHLLEKVARLLDSELGKEIRVELFKVLPDVLVKS